MTWLLTESSGLPERSRTRPAATSMAFSPLILRIPTPPSPTGVAMAQIVSCNSPLMAYPPTADLALRLSPLERLVLLPLSRLFLPIHGRGYHLVLRSGDDGRLLEEIPIRHDLLQDREDIVGEPIEH